MSEKLRSIPKETIQVAPKEVALPSVQEQNGFLPPTDLTENVEDQAGDIPETEEELSEFPEKPLTPPEFHENEPKLNLTEPFSQNLTEKAKDLVADLPDPEVSTSNGDFSNFPGKEKDLLSEPVSQDYQSNENKDQSSFVLKDCDSETEENLTMNIKQLKIDTIDESDQNSQESISDLQEEFEASKETEPCDQDEPKINIDDQNIEIPTSKSDPNKDEQISETNEQNLQSSEENISEEDDFGDFADFQDTSNAKFAETDENFANFGNTAKEDENLQIVPPLNLADDDDDEFGDFADFATAQDDSHSNNPQGAKFEAFASKSGWATLDSSPRGLVDQILIGVSSNFVLRPYAKHTGSKSHFY